MGCTALDHLKVRESVCYNRIGPVGVVSLVGVMPQCPVSTHLNLWGNQIGTRGTERLAGVLTQCPTLTHPMTGSI
jgi:hypothetical protein